jgi:hypothetical protein
LKTQLVGTLVTGASADATLETGWSLPFSGFPGFEHLAPTEVTNASQNNQPIGQPAADEIAVQLGLRKTVALTAQQYNELVSGGGVGGNAADANLINESIQILTNTTGRPLYTDIDGVTTPYVLGSYGLIVNSDGLLESDANADAPTRQVNAVLEPGGYFPTWCKNNGATRSLADLYASAFKLEAPFGAASQQVSGQAQLVTNIKEGVSIEAGMSMTPAIWLINFALIYTVNPAAAADMPAYWAPIPASVADAILASPTGQVPYSEFESAFQ